MNAQNNLKAVALMLALAFAGCKSAQDKANDAAIEQAKAQAVATGAPQQVVWTDKSGAQVTMIIQPPAPGQTTQQITTTRVVATTANGSTTNSTTTTRSTVPEERLAGRPVQQGAMTPGYAGPVSGPAPGSAGYGTNSGPGYQDGTGGQQYASGQADGPPAHAGGPVISPVDVNVPRGTNLAIRINQHISVKTSRAGDRFTGEVVRPVVTDGGRVAIPSGTPVNGVIDAAHRRGHFKGRSILELRLTSMELNGQRYRLDTADNVRGKKGKGKRSAAFIGGGAGLGMLVGGVASGGVGLLVGGLAGAGAGTAIGGLTGNRDIEIPAESVINFRLRDDLVVQPQ